MDDIRWNRQFSWQRQPIFGTWAVDISSSSARYTFGGIPSTFDPSQERLSRLSASLHHLSREGNTTFAERLSNNVLSFDLFIHNFTFLSFISRLYLFANRRIYIYIYTHLFCLSFSLDLSCQMSRTIDFLADTGANIVECKTNRGSYDRSYDTSTVFLACLETLKGKVLSKTSSDPSFTGQVRISTERRTGKGREKEMQLGGKDFAGAAHNFARKFDIQNRK